MISHLSTAFIVTLRVTTVRVMVRAVVLCGTQKVTHVDPPQ